MSARRLLCCVVIGPRGLDDEDVLHAVQMKSGGGPEVRKWRKHE